MEPSRKALQQPRSLSAAPGSTALNRLGPAREFKLQARVHRVRSGPARLPKATRSSQCSTPPPQGTAHPVRFIGPAPGRPATTTLTHRCAGFYGPQPAGPAREFKLQARVHRVRSGPARLLKVTRPSLGSTPPLQGTAHPVKVHRPRTGSACNHCSPLRRVPRPPTHGRPRSEAQVTSSGSSGPPWARPACSSNSPRSGFYASASGDGPASTLSQAHRSRTGSA